MRCRSTTTNTRHPSTPHPSVIIEQRRPHFCRRVADAQPPTQLSNTIERHRPHFAPERCQRTTNNTTSPPVPHASSLDVSACIFVPARCQSTTDNTRHRSTHPPSINIERRPPILCRRVADALPPTQNVSQHKSPLCAAFNTIKRRRQNFAHVLHYIPSKRHRCTTANHLIPRYHQITSPGNYRPPT